MASPSKLALIVNKIPLEPVDYSKFGNSFGAKRFYTPVRFRPISIRPNKLPKITTNKNLNDKSRSIDEVLTGLPAVKDLAKIEIILKSKLKFNVVRNKNFGYIKSSMKKKFEETGKIRSKQDSPVQMSSRKVEETLKVIPKMVDATFNTDFECQ